MALITGFKYYVTAAAVWRKGYLYLGRRFYLTMGATKRSSTRWWEQRRKFRGTLDGCKHPPTDRESNCLIAGQE